MQFKKASELCLWKIQVRCLPRAVYPGEEVVLDDNHEKSQRENTPVVDDKVQMVRSACAQALTQCQRLYGFTAVLWSIVPMVWFFSPSSYNNSSAFTNVVADPVFVQIGVYIAMGISGEDALFSFDVNPVFSAPTKFTLHEVPSCSVGCVVRIQGPPLCHQGWGRGANLLHGQVTYLNVCKPTRACTSISTCRW